jgi:tRNA pseudouridine32 synthase / 23S rRNA pseudouridine746 synthase
MQAMIASADMLAAVPSFTLIHADEALLIVDKPAGLLSVPGRGEYYSQHNLASFLQAQWADALIVHRLDMATSGLMVFARGIEMQRRLSLAFEKRRVAKRYEAVAEGVMAADSGEVDAPLIIDWPNRPRQIVDRVAGKPALTRWHVLARDGETTRVALEPVTGRSHQLRVHLQHIGHPIRGDEFYAPEPLGAPRLLLHARRLAFAHPASGEAVAFESPCPF